MARITKKAAASARNAAWRLAFAEGRVVRYGAERMQEFLTVELAQAAVEDADCVEVRIATVQNA